jgi:hypothetical protein
MEPAEVGPRQPLRLRALYAQGEQADLDWAFCTEQKPLSELGPIAKNCLAPDGTGLAEPFANGLEASGMMPADACRLFGPDRPAPKPNEPAGRPVDADPSGGYYQPVGVFDYDQNHASLFEARVSCSLPGVTREQFSDFQQRYVRNVNPQIDAVEAVREGEAVALDAAGEALRVRAGEALDLRVWTLACASELDAAARCGGAEPYLYFELASRTLVTRTETLSAAWFASAGRFRDSRTGLETSEDGSLARNVWTAPLQPGPVALWVVLRDNRGGVTWQRYAIEID